MSSPLITPLLQDNIPKRLSATYKAPKRLWIHGVLPSENRPWVAIVGSRTPSSLGRLMTKELSGILAGQGCVIVSGLARGIDAEAHAAALEQNGATVAILASSVDLPSPSSNKRLAHNIVQSGKGCLLSEYPPTTQAKKHQFIARNKIVAGLAHLTIVVEGGVTSGTRSTAEFALQEGREVGAVPGSPKHPMSTTPNTLLQEGAHVITSAEDALALLKQIPELVSFRNNNLNKQQNATRKHPLLQLLQAKGGQSTDNLLRQTSYTAQELAIQLSLLELEERIERTANGQIHLRTTSST